MNEKLRPEPIRKNTVAHLSELGLQEKDLENKEVLNIGDFDSLRKGQLLPHPDNTFDLVVSVNAFAHHGSSDDNDSSMHDVSELVANAVRESVRVLKDGGEARFGGVAVEEPEDKFDDEGFPKLPRVIRNPEVMKGFLAGMKDSDVSLVKYPEKDGENLFVLRKFTASERPWPENSFPQGTMLRLEEIDIHPVFRPVAKEFTRMATEVYEADTGKSMAQGEFFGSLMQPTGVVDETGGARFGLGDSAEDHFTIPSGYWRPSHSH